MQVTHVEDHTTHVVLGPNTAESFGISESAEFFNILSNTLYSDKILAVVREVLCNAWDAHIASGRTNLPIEVTLTHAELTIKDRGTGIKKALMRSTYCVYGNSTKQNDGEQTGGFGLGCKAPFAYVNHFEVINCREGEKTFYRISKSNGEVGGKPGMMEILNVPTDETGIQVKMTIQERDESRFNKLIRLIAAAGEMNVHLNGQKLDVLPFSEAQEGYLITKKPVADENKQARIFVRYGNVIYPIERNNAYKEVYNQVSEVLDRLPGQSYHSIIWRLVLQAKPHTISVTPSRESLSMTDHTIETIDGLLKDFLEKRNQCFDCETQKLNDEGIEKSFLNLNPQAVLSTTKRLVGVSAHSQPEGDLKDFNQIARATAIGHYPSSLGFRKKDILSRLRALIESGYGNRGKIQSFLKAYTSKKPHYRGSPDWFKRHIVAPLVRDMATDKSLSATRLIVYGTHEGTRTQARFRDTGYMFTEALKFRKNNLEDYLPFLRNHIILAYNRTDVEERASEFPEMKFWLGSVKDSLVYMVQRSDTRVEAARAFFAAQGFLVLDMTKRQKWESEPVSALKKEARKYKTRAKGIPVLSSVLPTLSGRISTNLAKLEDTARIENPEFIIKLNNRDDKNYIADLPVQESKDVVKLFGSVGGVVVNESQSEKYRDLGAKNFEPWLLDKVITEIQTNTRILSHLSVSLKRVEDRCSYATTQVLRAIEDDNVLSSYYGINSTLADTDRAYLRLWEMLDRKYKYISNVDVVALRKKISEVPISENLLKLTVAIKSSVLVEIIDCSGYQKLLGRTRTEPSSNINMQIARARDILIFAIAGQ